MKTVEISIKVTDLPVVKALVEFAHVYADHHRSCAAIDADGEWHRGNPACDCGFDEEDAKITVALDSGYENIPKLFRDPETQDPP